LREPCLNAYIKVSPDYEAFNALAHIYREEGDEERWKSTLDAFLDQPDHGLEHARVRVQIARSYMQQQRWADAAPYAEAAAQSYAEWAMRCAFECYESMGELDKADLWLRRIAERYGRIQEYLAWCRKYGRPVPDEEPALSADQVERLAKLMPASQRYAAAGKLLQMGHAERALRVFQSVLQEDCDARTFCFAGFFVASLADELGQPQLRDATLARIAGVNEPSQAKSVALARLLQRWLQQGDSAVFDHADFEELIADANTEDRVNLNCFAARFHASRQQPQEAERYFRQSAEADADRQYLTGALARQALEEDEPPTDSSTGRYTA
jgi:hypothetical protein